MSLNASSSSSAGGAANDSTGSRLNLGPFPKIPLKREQFPTWRLEAQAYLDAYDLWQVVVKPITHFYNDSNSDSRSSSISLTASQVKVFQCTAMTYGRVQLSESQVNEFVQKNGGFDSACQRVIDTPTLLDGLGVAASSTSTLPTSTSSSSSSSSSSSGRASRHRGTSSSSSSSAVDVVDDNSVSASGAASS